MCEKYIPTLIIYGENSNHLKTIYTCNNLGKKISYTNRAVKNS